MTWIQTIDPLGNLAYSALMAAIPIVFLFVSLAILRMKGHYAGIATLAITVFLSIMVFSMPVHYSLLSTLYGMMFGLWPIGWIVIAAVFLYNLTLKTGQFQIIKDSIASITEDRRLQAILIAFSFGAFLEGSAGFGVPVAITSAMLAGMGFNPLYAAGLCLIANTAPVAFGAIGIPVITAGIVSDLDPMVVSQMVGRQLFFISAIVPFWLVFIMSGWRGVKEVMPAILVSGLSFACVLWFSSNHLNPMIPDILSSIVSIISLIILLKFWKPRNIWKFKDEPEVIVKTEKYKSSQIIKAWSPFIVLTIMVSDWALPPVKSFLDGYNIKIIFSSIDNMILINEKLLSVVFNFNWLSATGTSILIAAIISAIILRVKFSEFCGIFVFTLNNLKYALLTIACFLGFAYVANWSGMTTAMGKAFTITGYAFPFISPFLGWLGVFITGSDTSSNALFCNMQRVTADSMDLNPVLTVAANSTGGVAAKMISPQNLVVATSSTGLTGKESDLFRFALPHSLFFVFIVATITLLQAYVFPWVMPEPVSIESQIPIQSEKGPLILILTLVVVVIFGIIINKIGVNKKRN